MNVISAQVDLALVGKVLVFVYVCVQRGESALHMAARAGQTEVVRCLLRNGALVDAMARVRQPHQP